MLFLALSLCVYVCVFLYVSLCVFHDFLSFILPVFSKESEKESMEINMWGE